MAVIHPTAFPLNRRKTDSKVEALRYLIDLGLALSSERNFERLLERFVLAAKEITNADGATLYLLGDGKLSFQVIRNDTLGIAMGGTTGRPIPFPPVLLLHDGKPNHNNVSAYAALTRRTVSIDDAYDAADFDFSGTKAFDIETGYRSTSFLTLPMKNHKDDVIGVIQLINARRADSGAVVPFDPELVPLVESLACQAAVALDNQQLIQGQKNLFNSFTAVLAAAVDSKSPYTGEHCQRVPFLTEMLARAACNATDGPFRDFTLSDGDWYELQIAGGLHDVGKVTTPVHIMDKATKLEKINDRIHEIGVRCELLKRDAELACREAQQREPGSVAALQAAYEEQVRAIDADFAFLAECNIGGEFMANEKIERIRQIARRQVTIRGETRPLLDDDEVMNLSVRRGTLNDADRKIINNHIVMTIQMLESLPFPEHLKRVPEIAGGHHEKMDGTGYPRGLHREQMSIPARMMGIADIFEALTASDRPYKKPKTLSESIRIMTAMCNDHHIDPDLFELFLQSGVYRAYAERFLAPEQIDAVDTGAILASLQAKRA